MYTKIAVNLTKLYKNRQKFINLTLKCVFCPLFYKKRPIYPNLGHILYNLDIIVDKSPPQDNYGF